MRIHAHARTYSENWPVLVVAEHLLVSRYQHLFIHIHVVFSVTSDILQPNGSSREIMDDFETIRVFWKHEVAKETERKT